MKISIPKLIESGNEITINFEVSSNNLSNTLWYKIPSDFKSLISTKSDCALIALLVPAMASGEDVYLDGDVSEILFYNVTTTLQKVLKIVYPELNIVDIHPTNLVSNNAQRSSSVATGFSGGVDSFCTLVDHFFEPIVPNLKITHLFFNNVGSHGKGEVAVKLFYKRYEHVKNIADLLNIPIIPVNSNVDSFYPNNFGFVKTETFRNASVPLLLQNGIGTFISSSTFKIEKFCVEPSTASSFSDLLTLPLISTDYIKIFSYGGQYSRVQKTLKIANYPQTYENLDVCVNAKNISIYRNCGECPKCLRTLATLEISGNIDKYAKAFNLKLYHSKKAYFFAFMKRSDRAISQEIQDFSKEEKFKLPKKTIFLYYSGLESLFNISKRALHKSKYQSIRPS